MPYFHIVAVMIGGRNHRWWNYSRDRVITSFLWPFLNGQVIEANYSKKLSLLNLGTAKYLRIFQTDHKLSKQEVELFRKNNSIGFECTSHFIVDLRLDKASKKVRSLLQKIALPPKHQIFVVMKLNDKQLDSAYNGAMRVVGEEFGYQVLRMDEPQNSEVITDQILDAIAESEIVLSDLTGARPNCYYETGFASAMGRELILSIREGEKPHFD